MHTNTSSHVQLSLVPTLGFLLFFLICFPSFPAWCRLWYVYSTFVSLLTFSPLRRLRDGSEYLLRAPSQPLMSEWVSKLQQNSGEQPLLAEQGPGYMWLLWACSPCQALRYMECQKSSSTVLSSDLCIFLICLGNSSSLQAGFGSFVLTLHTQL